MDGLIRIKNAVTVPAPADTGLDLATIATQVILPPFKRLPSDPSVLFCLPGGGLNKSYFDLDADGDPTFSFGAAMARRGHIVVLIDHLGVGESTRPDDGFVLHPHTVAATDAAAIAILQDRFREGFEGYPALRSFKSIGVGHSMGAMLTAIVQARFNCFDGVAVLGAGPYGLIDHLEPALQPLVDDPARAAVEIVPRLRAQGRAPYTAVRSDPTSRAMFKSENGRGMAALKKTSVPLIVISGTFAIIPGSWSPEAAKIDVPVLLIFGDQERCRTPHAVPAFFTGSRDVTLIVLPETGHTHFIFPSRELLWRRVGQWIDGLCVSPAEVRLLHPAL